MAGELIDGCRCVNCGQDTVRVGIMLTRTPTGIAIPEVVQKCWTCGQIGCDA